MAEDADAVDTTGAEKVEATEQNTGADKAPSSSRGEDKGAADTKGDAGDDVALYDDGEADESFKGKAAPKKDVTVPADWPDDWRERMAGEDKKLLDQLKRRKSPMDVIKSWQAAEQKIRSGEYKKASPDEDASPEEVAAWREAQGIPKDASGYKLPTVSGHEWNDADKAAVGRLQDRLHGANGSQKVFDEVMGFYVDIVREAREAQVTNDIAAKEAHEDARRAEYGGRYKAQNNLVNRLMKDPEAMPSGVAKALVNARHPETGVLLKHDKEFTRWLDDMAIARYGEGGLVTGEEVAAFNNREAELVKMMREDPAQYEKTGRAELAELRAKKGGRK